MAGGGLGRYIVDGFVLQDHGHLIAGGLLVAGLALGIEHLLALVERRVTSPGIRRADTHGVGRVVPQAADEVSRRFSR